MIYFKNRELRY